jgi:cell division protein FtsW (lipid II flippase)
MRPLLTLICSLSLIAAAAWFEADYAHRAWPHDWVGFCVDESTGPQNSDDALQPNDPAQAFAAKLDDLDARLARADGKSTEDWLTCASTQRQIYLDQLLWRRLFSAPASIPKLDGVQVARTVQRILLPLRGVSLRERAWFNGKPERDELLRHLRGKRLGRADDLASERPHRSGAIATLLELDAKAGHARVAAARLGSATSVVSAGVLLMWGLLAAWRLPTGTLLWLAPVWLAGVLVIVSLSLSAPLLRTIAVRTLPAWHGLIWWPLVAAAAGFLLMRSASKERWLGTALLAYRDIGGLARRAGLLCLLAAAVPLMLADPARRSEVWLGLAIVGLALFAARNALVLAVTNLPSSFGWQMVASVGTAVVGMALWREDRGSALLALGLVAAWFVFFTSARMALACVLAMASLLWWWSSQMEPAQALPGDPRELGAFVQGLADACQHLPGGERARLAACVQASGNSDVFRSLEMARAGWKHGLFGFGLVDLPGNGLAAARVSDRVILQMPSDYIAAPWVAAYGKAGLAALGLYACGLFALAARTLATLQVAGRSHMQLILCGIAGFGCIAAALRVLISSGGALAAIPLTGQSPPMLAFGGSAAVAFGLYLGIALASPRSTTQGDS